MVRRTGLGDVLGGPLHGLAATQEQKEAAIAQVETDIQEWISGQGETVTRLQDLLMNLWKELDYAHIGLRRHRSGERRGGGHAPGPGTYEIHLVRRVHPARGWLDHGKLTQEGRLLRSSNPDCHHPAPCSAGAPAPGHRHRSAVHGGGILRHGAGGLQRSGSQPGPRRRRINFLTTSIQLYVGHVAPLGWKIELLQPEGAFL